MNKLYELFLHICFVLKDVKCLQFMNVLNLVLLVVDCLLNCFKRQIEIYIYVISIKRTKKMFVIYHSTLCVCVYCVYIYA